MFSVGRLVVNKYPTGRVVHGGVAYFDPSRHGHKRVGSSFMKFTLVKGSVICDGVDTKWEIWWGTQCDGI